MVDSSIASLARFFPLLALAGGAIGDASCSAGCSTTSAGFSSSTTSMVSSFLALVLLAFVVFAFFARPFLVPPTVIVEAVVITVSSWPADVVSAIEGASDIIVACDWVESREALDPRAAFERPFFLVPLNSSMRAKRGQLGDLFRCSSLQEYQKMQHIGSFFFSSLVLTGDCRSDPSNQEPDGSRCMLLCLRTLE